MPAESADNIEIFNAAIFAVEILAATDAALAERLDGHKESLARSVAEKSEKIRREFEL